MGESLSGAPPTVADPARRRLGRRRRRLYTTIAVLATVATLSGIGGWLAHRASRPAAYLAGEEHHEITRRLDRGIPDRAPQPRFTDVTAEAGLAGFRTFAGARTSQLPEDMGSGAAWGDYDGDGDEDLFVVAAGGPLGAEPGLLAPSGLYENLGDGTFRMLDGFPETRIVGMAAAWGDYDTDGDLDLMVTGFDTLRLFRNVEGTFERDPAISDRPGFWAGASWSDFDLDGDLDLYVCGYVLYDAEDRGGTATTRQYGHVVPFTLNPSTFEPERNLLFRNDGRGGFDEVAKALGVDNPKGRSLGALWHDVDDDGRPDLYIANDISDNVLYLNRPGGFEDTSHAAWVADYRGAMGLAAGDWNRDGDEDLFVSHWIAQENALYDSLRNNLGGGEQLRFMDVADQFGLGQIALQRIGWGAEFADIDADGWQDLVVANGSTFETDDAPKRLRPQAAFLFWNDDGTYFHDLAPFDEALAEPHVSRGLALADYDGDGDLDLLFVDLDGGVRLLRNETTQGAWLSLRLRPGPGRLADGARAVLEIPGAVLRRTLSSVSYLSQSTRTLHFGLGSAERAERLEIRWPDGNVDVHDRVATGAWEALPGEALRRAQADAPVATAELDRETQLEFWRIQRAADRAMKVDGDPATAAELFRRALALHPAHEDSLYDLGNCLAELGEFDLALTRFDELRRLNPMSHRAHKRWGTLRALRAESESDVEQAQTALERAVEINPEATGALLVLAEIAVLRQRTDEARQRLAWVARTNPQSTECFFLLAWLAWNEDDDRRGAAEQLARARATLGDDWKPEGAAAEGDVRRTMHTDVTLFDDVLRAWDGVEDPEYAFAGFESRLRQLRTRLGT